ncbi:MAG: GTP cyclohydrolase [Bdellovibrio sp.]
MEKLSQTLVSQITRLQRRFESILENDFEHKSEEDEARRAAFEASQDLALIRGLSQGLPEDHIDRSIVVFSRLALFFDAGVLLENHDGSWKGQALFQKGQSRLIKNNSRPAISLPTASFMAVLKTDAKTLLQKLQLSFLDPEENTSCLLIKVSPDFAFVLLSSLPDIWLKEHTEHIRKALINGFAD